MSDVIENQSIVDRPELSELGFTQKPRIKNFQVEEKDGFYIEAVIEDIAAATAANYGVFFIARHPCEVVWVAESHKTAGNDAGTVTLNIEILNSGEALDAGDAVLVTAFDLKSTADTPVRKSGTDLTTARQLKEGDRLALDDSGTLTAVAHVCVSVFLKPLGQGDYR